MFIKTETFTQALEDTPKIISCTVNISDQIMWKELSSVPYKK